MVRQRLAEPRFKPGDAVRCIDANSLLGNLVLHDVYVVMSNHVGTDHTHYVTLTDFRQTIFHEDHFILLDLQTPTQQVPGKRVRSNEVSPVNKRVRLAVQA